MIGPQELSALTGIKVRTLTRLAATGIIPAVKVGRQWRFIRDDIEQWIRSAASNTSHRILVVDDNKDILGLLEAIIKGMRHVAFTATGGQEAIDILEKDRGLSMIVLDLQMPEVSGVDVMRWMSKNHVAIATMIFTGYPDSDLMEQALQFSHITVLKKPCKAEKIRGAIASILNGVNLPAAV
jgi:excisionase family DNA binding protein